MFSADAVQSTLLQSIAERDIEIPPHIDIYIVRDEAEPSDVNAVDFIVASAEAKVACVSKRTSRSSPQTTTWTNKLSTLPTKN